MERDFAEPAAAPGAEELRGGIIIKAPWLALVCLLAAWPDAGQGSWGPRGCAAVAVPARLPARPPHSVTHEWRTDDDNFYRLYRNGVHIANYIWDKDEFSFVGQAPTVPPWGARAKPQPEPAFEQIEAQPVQNFGIDLSKLRTEGYDYKINGKSSTRQQAWQAIEGGQLTDDTHKLRLTVIGSDAERKQVMDDVYTDPVFAAIKDKVLVQTYAPDHWAVARVGFHTAGHPTIYYQQPDGKVLHRQDDYQGGAVGLAEAIRKADPTYKPDQDKDRRKPDLLPDLAGLPPWVFVVLGVSLVLLLSPSGRD